MCYFSDRCSNFIFSPFNSSVCSIYCMHNPNVANQEDAPDMLVTGEKRLFVKLYRPKPKERKITNDKGEEIIDDEMVQADEFIKKMQEANIRLTPAEEETIKNTEGELIDGTEVAPPTKRQNTVKQVIQKMKKPKTELEVEEQQVIKDTIQVHDDAQSLNEKIAEIQEEVEKRTPCPYCGKEFKNVAVHLRFCKLKPKSD